MRVFKSSDSGAVQPRTVIWIAGLLVLLGVAGFLINHSLRKAPTAGTSKALEETSLTNLVMVAGQWRPIGSTNVFTGIAVEHYPDGVLRSRSTISNGLLHGLSEGWYTNGNPQVSEQFKEGVSHGLRTKWFSSGAKHSEANIVNGKLNGTFRQWHENGTVSEQVTFMAGQPEGTSMAYFASGYLKARVVMKDGQPNEQEFWKDGERKERDTVK